MARKSPPQKSASSPNPVPAALERLAKLAAAGTAPDRMGRETDKLLADWREDPSTFDDRLATLRENLEEGVSAAEESAGDVDRDDKAAVRGAEASLKALRAALAEASR